MNLKFRLFFIFVALLLISCKKDQQGQVEGHLLKRMISNSILQIGDVDTFLYDSKNRLIGIKALYGQTYDMAIEYDVAGNISKVTYSYQGVDQYSFTFVRNTTGQIVHKSATPYQGFQFAYDQSYTYNSLGQLASDTTFFQQTDSILYYYSFKYDNNKNNIENQFFDLVNPVNSGKTTFLFDSNPNPLNLLGSINYYVTNNLSYLNQNNFIEMKPWWSAPLRRQFTYQKNGLPSKIITENPNSPVGPFLTTTQLEYW